MVKTLDLETVGFGVDPGEIGEPDELEVILSRIISHGWLLFTSCCWVVTCECLNRDGLEEFGGAGLDNGDWTQ